MLIGEPFWALDPPDQATVERCHAQFKDDFRSLPELVAHVGELGGTSSRWCSATRTTGTATPRPTGSTSAPGWTASPTDPLAAEMRAELDTDPVRHVRHQREFLGWACSP
jgi:hypothetical protein